MTKIDTPTKVLLLVIVLFLLVSYFSNTTKDISVTGNTVTLNLKKGLVHAELAPEAQKLFLVDSGGVVSSGYGGFFMIPVEKALELERGFPEFLDCNSFDNIEGYKNSIQYVGFIPADKNVEIELNDASKQLHKGVLKITGSELIFGDKKAPVTGFASIVSREPNTFYLVSKAEIVDLKYQKNAKYNELPKVP